MWSGRRAARAAASAWVVTLALGTAPIGAQTAAPASAAASSPTSAAASASPRTAGASSPTGTAAPTTPAQDGAPSTTVHRCEVGGRVVFQQAPCPPGQAGRVVPVPPINVVPAPPRVAASASRASASAPAASPATPASAPAPLTDEQACLAFLRPLLRDPASGRIVSSRREGRVLFVQLQAADQRARPRLRDAACEFINGRVDDSWSRIQLKRLGWFAPRTWVQGSSPEARRAARALEESIEAPTQ